MKHPIHLLVPMSGQGTRYKNAGYREPKPLIPVNGVPMIERLLSQFPSSWPAHFVLAENHKKTKLPALLKKLRPTGTIQYVPVHEKGPGLAIEEGLKKIPATAPVFVSYCDYGMVWDAQRFEDFVATSACDACVISYRGFHAHYLSPQMYAYSRLDGERVVEVKEKGCFTNNRENEFASSGGYYFRSRTLLKKALAHQIKKNLAVNGEWYTSLTVQSLLEKNPAAHVRVFEIPGFFQWGTPADLENFAYWEKTFQAVNARPANIGATSQILMPMAGLGSRFEKLTPTPKPLISMFGKPMYQRALESLPTPAKTVIVTLEKVRPFFDDARSVIFLKETPSGQALSTQAGLVEINLEQDVIVSACDHAIVVGNEWKRFIARPNCDAAIFTIRGFPGTRRKPTAFAYVSTVKSASPFAGVKAVSVKKPISDSPEKDPLLVGTFWFRDGRLLKEGIDELVNKNDRVNGELYLDSIFNNLIARGKKVKIIPLRGYINWGDPGSMAEALYWQEQFGGHLLTPRNRFPGVFN